MAGDRIQNREIINKSPYLKYGLFRMSKKIRFYLSLFVSVFLGSGSFLRDASKLLSVVSAMALMASVVKNA